MRSRNSRILTSVAFVIAILTAFIALRSGARALASGVADEARTRPAFTITAEAAFIASGDSVGLARAIAAANQRPLDAVPFRVYLQGGSYTLYASGDIARASLPTVTGNVVLHGQTSQITLADAAALEVAAGASLDIHHVSISANGAAIRNAGTLNVNDADFGGVLGIENNGTMRVERSGFAGLTDTGIVNHGTATVSCSRLENNATAIRTTATLTVVRTAFNGNTTAAIRNVSGTTNTADNWFNGGAPTVSSAVGMDVISEGILPAVAATDPTTWAECARPAPQTPPANLLALQNGLGLFTDPGAFLPPMPPSVTANPTVTRSRFTGVDFSGVYNIASQSVTGSGAGSLSLNLFDDVTLVALNDSIETHAAAASTGFTWIGRIANAAYSEVILSFNGSTMAGYVRADGRLFSVQYSGSNAVHVITEVDLEKFAECGGALAPAAFTPPPVAPTAPSVDTLPFDGIIAPPLTGTPIIDVIVTWTSTAETNAGGRAAILNEVNQAIASANASYINSSVTQRVRLVYAGPAGMADSGDFSTDLSRLANASDGFADQVHTWRNAYKADLVAMLNNDFLYCGLAYIGHTNINAYGFSVTNRECITNYSFQHEMGHNQGSAHDFANSGGGGYAYSYSYGYQYNGGGSGSPNNFRTVMAYACSGAACPRINWFSNPNLTRNGIPMGTSSANNALSLNNMANTVAAGRTPSNTDTIGVFRQAQGMFYLRNTNNGGVPDVYIQFGGAANDQPVVGDWNGDGIQTPGVFRGNVFYLTDSVTGSGALNYTILFGGAAGEVPVVGDWDGDGKDGIGVFRKSEGMFYLRNTLTSGVPELYIQFGGDSADLPVAGDWDGDGRFSPGVFRNGVFYLTNRTTNGSGALNYTVQFGAAGDIPIAGDWTANQTWEIGVFRPSVGAVYLRNTLTSGLPDASFGYGTSADRPIVGRWSR